MPSKVSVSFSPLLPCLKHSHPTTRSVGSLPEAISIPDIGLQTSAVLCKNRLLGLTQSCDKIPDNGNSVGVGHTLRASALANRVPNFSSQLSPRSEFLTL